MSIKMSLIENLNLNFLLSKLKISSTQISKMEKYLLIFWLSGPFFYLIERDPADLWLTLIAISFLVRSYITKEWKWIKQKWVKCTFIFWIWCMISSLLSQDPMFSLQQSFVWIRFPIYAVAIQSWIGKREDFREIMLFFIFIGMMIMNLILITEIIVEPKHRLTWPYGDHIPGAYLAKFCLPIMCFFSSYLLSRFSFSCIKSWFILFSFLLTIVVTLLTGERINFLLLICTSFLTALVWKPKFLNVLILIIFIFISVTSFLHIRPDLYDRFTKIFIRQIPVLFNEQSFNQPYWGAWRSGIQQSIETPIVGIGPSMTRKNCHNLISEEISWLPGKNYCGNHPHNFYIQIFAETGIIGFLLGITMIFSIIYTCFKERIYNRNNFFSATAFVIPFGIFFPLQNTNSFFGQWGNLFIWFSLAFAISHVQNFRGTKKYD